MHINLRNNEKIEGWGQNEDDNPPSNNMLRILQNRIMNSVRVHQQFYSNEGSTTKLMNVRPATVRVRPVTEKYRQKEQLQSHPTIDLYQFHRDNAHKAESRGEGHVKYRNKSLSHNPIQHGKLNKENLGEMHKVKPKAEEFGIKKQSLIFKNYNSSKTRKNINNFHEMEIKMRKCRQLNNKTALNHKEKIHIVVESFRKGTEIKIGCCNLEFKADENVSSLGLEKANEAQYIKLSSRKQKLMLKEKEGRKKEIDFFADAHLSEKGN